MKRILSIMMVLIMLLGITALSGCKSKTQDTGSKTGQTDNGTTTPSSNGTNQNQPTPTAPAKTSKVTVTPPAGWEPVEGSVAIAQYMKDGASFIVTADSMPSEARTPDAFINFAKGMFSKTFDGTTFGDAQKLTIAGSDGWMLPFSCKVSGFVMKYNIYYIFKDGKAYTFTCGALSDNFDQLKGDYDAFMASVKFQ
jgi:hypothetical protein